MSEPLKWDEKMEKEFVDHDTDIVESTIAVSIFATLSDGIYQFDYPQQICRAGYLAARQRDAERIEELETAYAGISKMYAQGVERIAELESENHAHLSEINRGCDIIQEKLKRIAELEVRIIDLEDRLYHAAHDALELEAEVKKLRKKLDWWEQQGTAGTPDWYDGAPTEGV